MFVRPGSGPMCIITDYRTEYDALLDEAEPGIHVLDSSVSLGMDALGKDWRKCTRIALFEHDQRPSSDDRQSARDELSAYLDQHKPRVTVVFPNEFKTREKRGPTLCWSVFNAPDSSTEMRGTFYEYAPGQYVMPAHPSSKALKQVQVWQQARFLRRARDIASGGELLTCKYKFIEPSTDMCDVLRSMLTMSVAVDIESIESSNTITAIGVSDGLKSISLPYSNFLPYGHTEMERGWIDYDLHGIDCVKILQQVLASPHDKYLHNHTFDVPRLAAEGLHVLGTIHDTFAAHAIAFPELRHGLQHACADMLAIRPWKSAWHPKLRGITRDDEEFWICDPEALRDYNCDDSFHTWHLAQKVLPSVGVKP